MLSTSLNLVDGADGFQLGDRRQHLGMHLLLVQPDGEHGTGMPGLLLTAMIQLHIVDLHILGLDAVENVTHIVQGVELHIDIHVPGIFHDVVLHMGQHPDD